VRNAQTIIVVERRRLFVTIVAFTIPLVVSIASLDVEGLDPWGLRVLAVVAAGLLLWVSEAMPMAATSVAVVALLAIVAPGDSNDAVRSALAGFDSPAPFFLLGALALGTATVKTGLAQRFARVLVRGARGSGRRMYAQMLVMMPPMAILVPSALTRAVMLIPAYEAVFKAHRVRRGHRLPRLMMLATAMLQIQASTAVLTGGAVPVVASSLVGGFSWARWFAYMTVPNYTILFVMGGVLYLIYRPGPLPVVNDDAHSEVETAPERPMTAREWRALAIIITTTALWLSDGIHHLDPTIPALLGATALFLPVVGVMTWEDFDETSPWGIFLVTGSALSLAVALDRSGAASWIATTLLGQIPLERLPLVPVLLILMLMVAVVNIILPNRTAVLGITIPLMTSLSGPLGLNPVALGLMVPIVAQTTIYYPVQVATALVTFRTRQYAAGELLRLGLLLTVVSVLTIFLVALPWWSLLGEPIRK
jgi:anion transporter